MDYASSVQAVALRLTKLAATGAPAVGPKTSFVTDAFTRVSFTPEYEAGEEIQEKNAAGVLCTYYKMPDTIKKVNLELAICRPQPELYEFLAGGTLLMGADPDATGPEEAEALGWASPVVGAPVSTDGIGIEVWTRAIVGGRPAAVNPYWRWVFPSTQTRMSGDRVLENGQLANAFSGEGLGNLAFDDGPQNDLSFPGAAASAMYYVRDSAAPIGVNDYQAVLADA